MNKGCSDDIQDPQSYQKWSKMKYFIIILIIALIAYLVWIRTSTSLKLENGTVFLQIDRTTVKLDTTILKEEYLDLPTVMITQSVLTDDLGSLLVFERAVTDELYQFDHRSKAQLIKATFDATKVAEIYEIGNLAFYQVFTDREDVIDLIVHQSDDQAIRFVYGFSDLEFRKILKMVVPSEGQIDKAIKADVLTFDDPNSALHTKWSTPLHTIDALIIPLDSSS